VREVLTIALLFGVAVILGELLVAMDGRLQLNQQLDSIAQFGSSFSNHNASESSRGTINPSPERKATGMLKGCLIKSFAGASGLDLPRHWCSHIENVQLQKTLAKDLSPSIWSCPAVVLRASMRLLTRASWLTNSSR